MPGPPNLTSNDLSLDLDSYVQTQQALLAAAHHDLESLRAILKTAPATLQDPETGFTLLHAAIGSCAPEPVEAARDNGERSHSVDEEAEAQKEATLKQAEQTLKLLLQNGAIWNDLDLRNETPGCLALRLGFRDLYEIMVDAGVRAELLLNRLDSYDPISEDEDEDEGDENDEADVGDDTRAQREHAPRNPSAASIEDTPVTQPSENANDASTQTLTYLSSALSFTGDRILDSAANGVMMAWESTLMRRTASLLVPREGLRVLNIGFGMGIFDSFIQDEHRPGEHHIVEAHPDVLRKMTETGWDASTNVYTKRNVTVHSGTWQEVLPQLVEQNLQFDAIFFDTFAESYGAFREFFSEFVISLLTADGRWSFFHGLGADRQICYDVYTKVVEMEIFEAGFDVDWEDVQLPELSTEAQNSHDPWQGVRRKYFDVEKYRLPVCKFVE